MSGELSSELVGALKGAIKLNEMKAAVAQLRVLLESGENGEDVYQSWCESHSWAFGNAYVMRDEIRNISAGDRLDILLPSVMAGYRDLVELKRPDMPVLKYDEGHRLNSSTRLLPIRRHMNPPQRAGRGQGNAREERRAWQRP